MFIVADRNAALRAEVRRLHRAVTKKVSRIKSNTGAGVSGTHYDPRLDTSKYSSMNARQLRAQAKKLESFVNRKTQFVSGYMKKPLPRAAWNQYKQAEQNANQRLGTFYDRVKDLRLPGKFSGMTVSERGDTFTSKHPQMQNPSFMTPTSLNRTPKSYEYEKRLKEATEQQLTKATRKWFKEKIDAAREQYGAMAEAMGRPDLYQGIEDMSDERFALLVFYTPFMNNASLVYENAMMLYDHTQRPWLDQVAKTSADENLEWLEWAKEIEF